MIFCLIRYLPAEPQVTELAGDIDRQCSCQFFAHIVDDLELLLES